jgi:hypothetical protein
MKINYLILLIVIAIFHSCKSVNNEPVINPLDGLTKLKEGYALGASAKVELWGKKNFFVGYNNLTVVVYDSLNLQQKILSAHVNFIPVVTAGSGTITSEQRSPVEDPDETAVNGVFSGAIAFIKASDINDSWKLGIHVHNHKYDKEGDVFFDISVDDLTPSLVETFTSINSDSSKFVLTMVKATTTGSINNMEFLLNKNVSLLEWTTDNSYAVEFDPEMVDMFYAAHTSISTKNIGNGHYTGNFDFSMEGEWKINVIVKKNGIPISQNLYFTMTN